MKPGGICGILPSSVEFFTAPGGRGSGREREEHEGTGNTVRVRHIHLWLGPILLAVVALGAILHCPVGDPGPGGGTGPRGQRAGGDGLPGGGGI